nr:probable serine/threonine-protein kinase DDB_G0282963 [Parasteatoda tepidariorum]
MDNSEPGPSNAQVPVIKQDVVTSEEESGSIPYVDSPESPPGVPGINIRKASIAAQQQLHDGIILLITSDSESQRSPNGSIAASQHPLSEFYLLPLPPDASGNRRYSLQDRSGKDHHHHPERKASCPDTELHVSPDRSRRGSSCSNRKSDLDISKDRLTPTSFSSRRSSNASACHSRRSSNCSTGGGHHRRRSSNCTSCSRRSSNSSVSHSRRSSSASHRSSPPSHGSRRSSNCSRRSSHFDSDEESFLHHHHHHSHRGSRTSLDPLHRGSAASVEIGGFRRGSHLPLSYEEKGELDEREELEMGGIPPRHRRIIIMIIGSVSIFILVMSVVLIAVSLTLSPTIDDLGESLLFIYFNMVFRS